MCTIHRINVYDILRYFSRFSEVNMDFDTCLLESDILKPGSTKKLKTNMCIQAIPDSYNLDFDGIRTKSGIWTKEGVVVNENSDFIYVYVHNISSNTQVLQAKHKLGVLKVSPNLIPVEYDFVDEIYLHGGLRHRCTSVCEFYVTQQYD